MLDIKLLRENPDKVKEGVAAKQIDPKLVDEFLSLDERWRKLTAKTELLRAKQKKAGEARNINEAKKLKEDIKNLEANLQELASARLAVMQKIPNLPITDVPVGRNETENKVIRSWGKIPEFNFVPKDHIELGEALGIIDTKKASEISGARFSYLKGGAALLEIALINYVFNFLTSEKELKKIALKIKKGYPGTPFIPVFPPVMIRPEVFRRMGRLTDADKDERYHLEKDNVYLVGSAEHTLGPMHMDETLPEGSLPLRYVGFSTSFRREAGSYGKDTRGILRMHQFDKLEMESFTKAEDSLDEQNFFVAIQENILQSLKIPYQVVAVCTGDMGKPDARQIDLEAWMPGQNKYRETHTADLMTDYQARRLGTKIKYKNGKTEIAHMNDATACAIGRTIVAIMENYQTKDGKINVPKVLQKYVGKKVLSQ